MAYGNKVKFHYDVPVYIKKTFYGRKKAECDSN